MKAYSLRRPFVMKNLSAFPRFPLSGALMILITLVVCLAGFTKAEVNPNYRKQGPSLRKNENFFMKEASFSNNIPDTHQASEMRGHELRGKHFFNLKNFPESFFDRPIKRQSDYFGDSSDSESEKESDGYGYDDDEYYHFNFKRNDEPDGKTDNSKAEKEKLKEEKNLNAVSANNPANQKNFNNNKEDQTIEVLNYQESHPVIAQDSSDQYPNSKPLTPKSSSISTLRGTDFKENSAINENKDRNKEAETTMTASETKITEVKQDVKATEPKDTSKLQDSKIMEDSEKKGKELALKSDKDSDAVKSLKGNSNISEEKEKPVKLTAPKDSIDKISSSKIKGSETTKLTKEDKDVGKFNEKINTDVFNANALSEISNGANFVGNDYKDNLDVLKSLRSEGDQKSYGENPENEKIINFGEYVKDAKENQEKYLKEKRINALKSERNRNYDFLAKQSSLIRALQGSGKASTYGKSAAFDFQTTNNLFKKREPWRENEKMSKLTQEFPLQLGQQIKQDQDPTWNQMRHTLANLPASELENTDYHKNFIKSLKKYKSQNENAKNSSSDTGYYLTSGPANLYPKAESKKKKRSKPKKRRSMGVEKKSEDSEKSQSEKIRFRNQKRKAYSTDESFADSVHECLKSPHGSHTLNINKANKEETNLLDDNKYFDQWNRNRRRRKSGQKFEYEIKIINHRQPDMKNVRFSRFSANRLKKDLRTKLGTEDKYLKKYPYSKLSHDDLTKISNMRMLHNDKKLKRKASIWKRDNQKSIIQTRAVPSGYYSNRVKFGQKNFLKSNEKTILDSSDEDVNNLSNSYFSQSPLEGNKNFLQRSWQNKQLDYAYEPGKRFEENEHLGMGNLPTPMNPISPIIPTNPANSLLLLKKDERVTKVFQEDAKPNKESEINPSQLAKILSQDKNYLVIKKADGDKLRNNNERESYTMNLKDLEKSSYANKQFPFLDSSTSGISSNGWSTSLKSLRARSSNSEKNDKKCTSVFHDSGSDSNISKPLEKFRDMADFFQDNEQENSNNQYFIQEAKESPDIVFSQDKLPDPIIISHEDNSKDNSLKQEQVNPIFAISNNFRNLDQQTKKVDFPEARFENPDFEWKPSLKQAFPEAKSVNSVVKNGNEIIVLDLNGNPLKFDHEHIYKAPPSKDQAHGNTRLFLVNPNQYLVSNIQDVSMNDLPFPLESQVGEQEKMKMNLLSNDRAVAIIRSADNQSEIPESLHELNELPEILKTIMLKVPVEIKPDAKLVNKQTSNVRPHNDVSSNYQFFQDFSKTPGGKVKKEVIISSKSIPQQPFYTDKNLRNLGNLLQSLLNPGSFSDSSSQKAKNGNPEGNQKREEKFQNVAIYHPDFILKRQNLWPIQEKNKNFIPFSQEMWESSLKPSEEMGNILRIDGGSFNENSNESKLRKELAAASEKIHRLRREGMEAGKLRKTIEDALSFKETREADKTQLKGEDKSKKYNSESVGLKSDDKASIAEAAGNEKSLKSQLKDAEEIKEGLESEKTSKSDYENHLSELFENLNANKNQKNSKENTWSKKKRMNTSRRKRFSEPDLSNKVSKTEVQNKVIKNSVEDNYESVYSPGLKRKLLSTSNEMEDLDRYSDPNKHDDDFNAMEVQKKHVKNEADECVDRTLVKLFSVDGNEAEKNRARRSAFHSNFKREIDLDESMPNDFQNFLMTSLGGFGSQKREVVKKGEALWEGKEMAQDNYNQIVENGKDTNEDSALEKREVSSSENLKSQNYKSPLYYSTANQESGSTSNNRADKNIRPDENMIKLKPTKYAEEKLPTQIRIQISNTSNKEKKSSKPIMEENETTSTEMENLPKEKEFFDKNKVNPLLSRNFNKLRHSGATYSDNEYDDAMNKNLGFKRKPYRPYWWEARIRKKSTGERSLGFGDFDQKSVDSLVQVQQTNRDPEQLAQKVSMITRLPQVETVYNPTQGANKAQIERSRLGKTNSVKSKSLLNTKNNFQSTEPFSFDDGFIKSYMKSDKGGVKEYGDPQWKALNEKMSLDHEAMGANSPALPSQIGEPASFSGSSFSPVTFSTFRSGNLKWPQSPYSGYFYRGPSSNIINSQVMYDVMKLKQQMKNHNGLDSYDSKQYLKQLYNPDNEMQENFQKSKSPSYSNWMEGFSNNFDFSFGKKPLSDYPDSKNYENSGMKIQLPKDFGLFKHSYAIDGPYTKSMYERPPPDIPQVNSMDNSKENDYIDGIDDDYPEMEAREPQPDDVYRIFLKDPNKSQNPTCHNLFTYKTYKNSFTNPELDNTINGEEKEFEDYEEEDQEPEDYSQYSGRQNQEVELEMSRLSQGSPKFQENIFHNLDNKYYNSFSKNFKENTYEDNMLDSNSEGRNNFALPVGNLKSDPDPVSGSNDLLKKANEKSSIFRRNLMKNLYGANNYEPDFQNKASEDTYGLRGNKLSKRKLSNYPIENSQIGNRMFYAEKSLSDDTRNFIPSKIFFPVGKRNNLHTYYSMYDRHPFKAQFAGGENDFDHESEERGMRFNDNFVAFEKDGISQNEKNDEELENVEDVEENVEDGGEDNVLENVIGKYIMRKRIVNSNDLGKASEKALKSQDNDKTTPDESNEHKIRKRSADTQSIDDQMPKILKKRWSSGHLTENNFRKYHKKNLTKKRHISDLLSIPYTFTGLIDDQENGLKKEKSKDQMKRSALDIFRKITSKEKDKKAENADGRTAGFEPLLSLSEKSKGFIKDTKDASLFQEKSSSKENTQPELRNNPPELKAHYPNEGQRLRAQLADRKKGKAKESEQVPLTKTSQGPWKVELNSKYERPDWNLDDDLKTFKDSEKMSMNNQSGRYKAFLVISNNANSAEQSSKNNHPSVSKLFQSESSSIFWPKSEESIKCSANQVRKRSLTSTTSDKDAEQTSENHAVTKADTENNNTQNESTASKNTKNFPKENPYLEASQVVEKNSRINRSFATDSEENQNLQFFSKGKLFNRKSVFPPSSDSNIIRDSRHINEETSEYHSQRIVDAILSQVSENSQFKKLIAPGLAMRTPAYKEVIDSKSKPKTEMNFSDEFQSFLKKFMFDLENLAEQHVQKRMCKKIDDDLKQFLQSLLIPVENNDNEMTGQQENYSLQPPQDAPQKKNMSHTEKTLHDYTKNVFDDLRKKQHIFKKIVEKYQTLSKNPFNAKNENIFREFDETKGESQEKPCSTPKSQFGKKICSETNDRKGLNARNNETNTASCNRVCKIFKAAGSGNHYLKSNPGSIVDLKPVKKGDEKKTFPVFCFYKLNKIDNPNQQEKKITTSSPVCENTVPVNNTAPKNCDNSKNKTKECPCKKKIIYPEGSKPESFDLMPSQPLKKPNIETLGTAVKPVGRTNTGNVRTKHSAFGNKKFSKKSVKHASTSHTELNRLGLDDAAGLQLALRNQYSWVGNPDMDKTPTNVPRVKKSELVSSQQRSGTRVSQKSSASALSVDDLKNPQTFVDFYSDYSGDNNQNEHTENSLCRRKRPKLVLTTFRKIYQPKIRSYDTATTNMICEYKYDPDLLFIKVPAPSQVLIASSFFNGLRVRQKQCRERKIYKKDNNCGTSFPDSSSKYFRE